MNIDRGYLILLASTLITFVLGSVHAFSVFIVPLEQLLQLPRSEISLIYSFTLVAITISVLFGYLIYGRIASWLTILITCLIAIAGLAVAASATSWWLLFFGYSLLFGGSNGIGYGYCLQLAARELPQKKGFAMGAVTAAYAVGSIVFANLFASQIASLSIAAAFYSLAWGIAGCGLLAVVIMYFTRANYGACQAVTEQSESKLDNRRVGIYWLAYMFSVFAGLMAIGHAAGISLSKSADVELSVWSAMLIGIGSAIGGFLSGWLVDRWSISAFLVGLPSLSAAALLALAISSTATLTLLLFAIIGFCYGAIIAIYPVAISNEFGVIGAKAYGRVFTAWGFAGLVAPWAAGVIYDSQGNYSFALVVASATALLSAITVKLGGFESNR